MPASISTVRKDAVLEDGRSTLVDDEARTAVGRIRVPTTLLWAPRGLLDQAPGLLSPELVAASLPELPHVEARLVEDVNHYSILFAPDGAASVLDAIVERAASQRSVAGQGSWPQWARARRTSRP